MADSSKMALIPCRDEEKHPDLSLLFNKLCDELVTEILVRLPTKSAVKFKVVCKKWYSLISSPSFVSHFIHLHPHPHRDRVVESSMVLEFRHEFDSEFQIISGGCSSLLNLYGESVFRLSYLPCASDYLRLEGSFADLILCSYLNPTTEVIIYYISNLLTRQWISLPPVFALVEDFKETVSIGFLCKPRHGYLRKFTVVRLCLNGSESPHSQFKLQLFSSKRRKWRTYFLSSSIPLASRVVGSSLVAYRGMLHWLNLADCIVVYDPCNDPKTFSRVIHLPVPLPFFVGGSTCFGVCQDRLRLLVQDPSLEVWELEDYDSGLWNLVYKINLQNLIHNGLPESELCSCSLVSSHPEYGNVIFLEIGKQVVLLDINNMTIGSYHPIKENSMFGSLNVFHLADQCWPTAVSSLH